MTEKKKKGKGWLINILLLCVVVGLAVVPFFIAKNASFNGADGKAKDAISEIKPDYKPWFSSFWTPPSSEVESLLFALQAAIGAGVIGYGLGYMKGRGKHDENEK